MYYKFISDLSFFVFAHSLRALFFWGLVNMFYFIYNLHIIEKDKIAKHFVSTCAQYRNEFHAFNIHVEGGKPILPSKSFRGIERASH